MSRDRTCPHCYEREHHKPDCREMLWPDGHPRGTVHETGLKAITLEEELGKIFAGSTERMIERHLRTVREASA